jgi:hypothetical protein
MGARTKPAMLVASFVSACSLGACNAILGNDPWQLESDASTLVRLGSDGGPDGSRTVDSSGTGPTDGRAPPDSGSLDATNPPAPDSAMDTGQADSSPPTGLDPCLVLPDAAAPVCSPINTQNCPAYGFCAIDTQSGTTGRCTSCPQGSCEGPLNSICQTNDDCDDIFQCYCGHCLTLCLIDSGECTPYCLNVGNEAWGVCMNPN